ncbi:ExeA family protein [Zobellella maritima]|uniref:ExeA family protein n=1 Tax=Zobellella maritima TaxID=2059725 RepID=UPI000E308184|nr:ExeA family protein [Zobellella maritima]
MYGNYFGLSELPFSIAPDPRYLYLSQQHREALAHLHYGLNSDGGFVLLTGEVGTGKTTVCRCLLEQVPAQTDLAFILNPRCNAQELLSAICDELEIPIEEGEHRLKPLTDAINTHLLQAHGQGRRIVLIIDEAQNLSTEVLEQIRLLTNLETNQHKLLQIILLGQPELLEKLNHPELRQLAQRITARYHLAPLCYKEMQAYIAHRLAVAGIEAPLFQPASLKKLYRITQGIPRLVNVICDRALLGAYVQRQPRVELATLNKAAYEVLGKPDISKFRRPLAWAGGLLLLAIGLLAGSQLDGPRFWPTPDIQQVESGPVDKTATERVASLSTGPIDSEDIWQWPPTLTTDFSQILAYQRLFSLWGIEYQPADHPVVCRFARSRQLDCSFQEAGLGTLRQQNHPAVFKLTRPDGAAVYATLTHIDTEQDRASLIIGDRMTSLSLAELEDYWPGSYVLLWRPPPDYQDPLYPGSQGKTVTWLEQQLARWQGRPPRPAARYDEQLMKEVKAFQQAHGLNPDGIFGPNTGIYLNASLVQGLPLLSREGG